MHEKKGKNICCFCEVKQLYILVLYILVGIVLNEQVFTVRILGAVSPKYFPKSLTGTGFSVLLFN